MPEGQYCTDALIWGAGEKEIVPGYGNGTFGLKDDNLFEPQSNATRTKLATMLHRYAVAIEE